MREGSTVSLVYVNTTLSFALACGSVSLLMLSRPLVPLKCGLSIPFLLISALVWAFLNLSNCTVTLLSLSIPKSSNYTSVLFVNISTSLQFGISAFYKMFLTDTAKDCLLYSCINILKWFPELKLPEVLESIRSTGSHVASFHGLWRT